MHAVTGCCTSRGIREPPCVRVAPYREELATGSGRSSRWSAAQAGWTPRAAPHWRVTAPSPGHAAGAHARRRWGDTSETVAGGAAMLNGVALEAQDGVR